MAMPDENEDRLGSRSSIENRLPDNEYLCSEVETYIRAKPFRAIAIALFAGIVVGKILL
ncbi:MAG TPA: hypothetical protein VHU23_04380 [Rhizomicrobium sp.]|jgi:ElaB/YqjD/DUF883 family membrane-anchored ribosome-binding protein|nr:hypothetical protein [Rhizomicrobium sp.]